MKRKDKEIALTCLFGSHCLVLVDDLLVVFDYVV